MDNKKYLLSIIDDLIAGFLYYDRKEDDIFPIGKIEKMIKCGDITLEEIEQHFIANLRKSLECNQE